jgi:hypothetical protein
MLPVAHNLMSAAATAGVSRSIVLRAIKAKRISAQRDAKIQHFKVQD